MRSLLIVLLMVCSGSVQAQTTVRKLAWDQPGVSTVVAAQALVYRLAIDTAPAVTVPQTCTLAGSVVSCTTPLAALGSGTHTLTLTVDNGFDAASAVLSGSSPASPISLKIVITVTVP